MFSSSDRSIKASVPWYSNWKDTLMEMKESSLNTGIFYVGLSFPECSHSTPAYYLFSTQLLFKKKYLSQLTCLIFLKQRQSGDACAT